jgi:hypothetical protein
LKRLVWKLVSWPLILLTAASVIILVAIGTVFELPHLLLERFANNLEATVTWLETKADDLKKRVEAN